MTLSQDQWKQLYQRFEPRARLDVGDQDLFVLRPGAVAGSIRSDLELGFERRAAWVVCGTIGSGKSSELVHLGKLLWDTHAVVGLDVYQSTAAINQISPAEVLFLIGAAAARTAADIWGQPVSRDLTERLARAFQRVLSQNVSASALGELLSGVALFTANLAAPGSVAAVGAAAELVKGVGAEVDRRKTASRPILGGLTRPLRDDEPDLEALLHVVTEILVELARIRPPVVLVDGLDKVSELPAIRSLFSATRTLARLDFPVVYTAPITLMLSTEWQSAGGAFKRERLTNIVTTPPPLDWVTLPESYVAQGRSALREVIARRVQRDGLKLDDVFEPDALVTLTLASGGLMRDLIHLVNRAIRAAVLDRVGRIGAAQADAAVVEIRKEYEITFNTARVTELQHVRAKGEPSESTATSHDLLLGGYVLPYANGRVWFEPHPILRGLRPGI